MANRLTRVQLTDDTSLIVMLNEDGGTALLSLEIPTSVLDLAVVVHIPPVPGMEAFAAGAAKMQDALHQALEDLRAMPTDVELRN